MRKLIFLVSLALVTGCAQNVDKQPDIPTLEDVYDFINFISQTDSLPNEFPTQKVYPYLLSTDLNKYNLDSLVDINTADRKFMEQQDILFNYAALFPCILNDFQIVNLGEDCYPNEGWYRTFSVPLFTSDRKYAVIKLAYMCGGIDACRPEYLAVFERSAETWKEIKRLELKRK